MIFDNEKLDTGDTRTWV